MGRDLVTGREPALADLLIAALVVERHHLVGAFAVDVAISASGSGASPRSLIASRTPSPAIFATCAAMSRLSLPM